MEGPRALRADELESLRELVDEVFRKNSPRSMFDDYPQLFNQGNLHRLRVCVDDGKVVTHIGYTERFASILGCTVKVGCIGAVATHPDYRGRGLATRTLLDVFEKFKRRASFNLLLFLILP